jgi:hypothetical protein
MHDVTQRAEGMTNVENIVLGALAGMTTNTIELIWRISAWGFCDHF